MRMRMRMGSPFLPPSLLSKVEVGVRSLFFSFPLRQLQEWQRISRRTKGRRGEEREGGSFNGRLSPFPSSIVVPSFSQSPVRFVRAAAATILHALQEEPPSYRETRKTQREREARRTGEPSPLSPPPAAAEEEEEEPEKQGKPTTHCPSHHHHHYSLTSSMPPGVMQKSSSPSGKQGES